MRNLLFVALLGLVVYTILDVARSEADERYGISRVLWILLIVLLPVLGSIAWLVARSQARARGAGGGSGGGGGGGTRPSRPGPRRPSGPVAPDDDPEFLWRLERMQRRAEAERGTDAIPPQPGSAAERPGGAPTGGEDDAPGHDSPGHDSPGHGTPGPRTGA